MAFPNQRIGLTTNEGRAYAAAEISRTSPRPEAPNYDKVHREIINGLKHEKPRLENAWQNRQWYEGNFEPFLEAIGKDHDLRPETVRVLNWYRRIVRISTKYLYRPVPKRTIQGDDETTAYLAQIYGASGINGLLAKANAYAIVGGCCAVQVELSEPADDEETQATLDMIRPAVTHRIWPADQFVVWTTADRPETPWAVGVIDYFDERRRLRVWTSERLVTYETAQFDRSKPWEGTAYNQVATQDNFLGFVPFAFLHWETPAGAFWSVPRGDELTTAQEHILFRLWKQSDDIAYTRALLVASNTPRDFRLPSVIRAGEPVHIPANPDAMGQTAEPNLGYVMADLSYLEGDRADLEWYMNLVAEDFDVPEAAHRLKAGGANSGAQVVAEQLPVLEAAEMRQVELEKFESDLALVTLLTAGKWLSSDNEAAAGKKLIQAAAKMELAVVWGNPIKRRPGPEFDQHQQFKIINGTTSKTKAIAEAENLTREQAAEELDRVNRERLAEAKAERAITAASQPEMAGPQITEADGNDSQPAESNPEPPETEDEADELEPDDSDEEPEE